MAVTKIWAIHDSVSRVVDYCTNPSKSKLSDLEQVLLYAADKGKTLDEGEQQYAVTGIGCRAESAAREMATSPSRPVRLRRRNAIASAWRRRGGFGGTTGRCLSPPTSTPALITTTLL